MARFRVLILVAALVTACSAPPPPPAAQSPEATPPQVDQPASQPEPVAVVPPMLAEIKALMRQQGMGGEIQHRLEMARSLAGSDANLLAQVAGVALAWDPQLALAIAEEAIAADAGSMPARVALGAAWLPGHAMPRLAATWSRRMQAQTKTV